MDSASFRDTQVVYSQPTMVILRWPLVLLKDTKGMIVMSVKVTHDVLVSELQIRMSMKAPAASSKIRSEWWFKAKTLPTVIP